MPQNGINHPGVTALAQAFAINPLLRVINLNDNTFTEKGAVAMAEVRGVRVGLRKLVGKLGSCPYLSTLPSLIPHSPAYLLWPHLLPCWCIQSALAY